MKELEEGGDWLDEEMDGRGDHPGVSALEGIQEEEMVRGRTVTRQG